MQGSICVYVKGGKLTSLHRLRTKETCDKNLEEAILDSLIQLQQKSLQYWKKTNRLTAPKRL